MRYALRKQDKIAAVLGSDYLNEHIIKSLDDYFKRQEYEQIIDCIESAYTYTSELSEISYPVLRINDVSDDNAMLEFAVLDIKYDVLKLSFLGRIKG